MRPHRRFFVLVAVAMTLTIAAAAAANMAKWWADGEGRGAIVPRNDTEVGVDSEDLVFDLASSLETAKVTATYRMTHGGASATEAEVAFVVVEGEHSDGHEHEAEITIDGAPVAHRVLTAAEALAPILDGWLASHPDVVAELERMAPITPRFDDWQRLSRVVPGCQGECYGLTGWYRMKKHPERYDTDKMRREAALDAAKIAVPEEVQKLYAGWSTRGAERDLAWLLFQIPFAPGAAHTVVVRYQHRAGWDGHRSVNDVFLYDYVLSPAKRWAKFGAFHLAVRAPPKTQLRASLPLVRAQEGSGDVYRADLPTVPSGELSFEVMSLEGVPFGLTHSWVYWCALLAAMFAATFALGRRLGRYLAKESSRAWRVVASTLAGGLLGLGINVGLVAGMSKLTPRYALGSSYEAMFGLGLAILFFTVTGIAISIVTAGNLRSRTLG